STPALCPLALLLYSSIHFFVLSLWFLRFFLFTDTAPTEIYTLSLHDALPIFQVSAGAQVPVLELEQELRARRDLVAASGGRTHADRKSTRLNSSHVSISYAVFCLKKKKKKTKDRVTHNYIVYIHVRLAANA